MNEITVSFVRDADGEIDADATLAAVRAQVASYVAQYRADQDTIKQAVDRAWSDYPNTPSMNLDAVATFAMRHLGPMDPSTLVVVKKRITDYVRSATNLFALTKGSGGGVLKLDRLTPEQLTKVQAQRDKAALKVASKTA